MGRNAGALLVVSDQLSCFPPTPMAASRLDPHPIPQMGPAWAQITALRTVTDELLQAWSSGAGGWEQAPSSFRSGLVVRGLSFPHFALSVSPECVVPRRTGKSKQMFHSWSTF